MAKAKSKSTIVVICALIMLVLVAGAFVALLLLGGNGSSAENDDELSFGASDPALAFSADPPGTAAKFPAGTNGMEAFNLKDGDVPAIDSETTSTINGILDKCHREGSVGFLLMNLKTGKGVSYNIDETIYGASAIKGIFCTFVCEGLVDSHRIEMTDDLKNKLSATIIHSDNAAFRSLRAAYNGSGWTEWCDAMGLAEVHGQNQSTVAYTTRTSAVMWLHIKNYLDAGRGSADFLRSLFEQTDYSFIKLGLESEMANGAYVINKAGYYNPDNGDPKQFSQSDSGIVKIGGDEYLFCVMSGLRWTIINTDLFKTQFIPAVFGLHTLLS